MNFSSQFSTTIIATTIALISPQATVALTPVEVNNIARKITVRISRPQPGGTGIIVKKEGNTYTVRNRTSSNINSTVFFSGIKQ